jgi:D-amino-acid dehydrogenase
MKILILGAGVIGCTAAYELAADGHEVTLIERQPGPALETSYANAGEVSPGYSAPWAGPGVPLKAVKWLLMQHRPLVLRPHLDWPMLFWILAMLRNCTAARYEINKARMVRLAEYSRDCMKALRASTGIAYDERMQGTLQLFRTPAQLEATGKDTAILDRYGVAYELLDQDGCIRHEPALARVKGKFQGGLRLPGDETGDCYKFSVRIAELAQTLGAKMRFNEAIHSLLTDGKRITGVVTDQGRLQADAYLVALGSHSPRLLSPLGVDIPVYPVKGYSITVPITRSPSRASVTASVSAERPSWRATRCACTRHGGGP